MKRGAGERSGQARRPTSLHRPVLGTFGALVQYPQDLQLPLMEPVGGSERVTCQHQLSNIGNDRRTARAGKALQLAQCLQDGEDDLIGAFCADSALVMFVDRVEVTLCFVGQYDAWHALPT